MARATRRKFLGSVVAGTVAAGAGASLFLAKGRTSKVQHVVISGWGGAMQRAMREAYFKPFTRETGIEVIEQTYGGHGLARIKAQLNEGRVQVDLLDGAPFWPHIGREQGLLGKITVPGIDESHFIPGAIGDYAFGYSTASWGIAYVGKSKNPPKSWRDFWNIEGFSGRRAFYRRYVARHLEYALMAGDTAPNDLYPLTDRKVDDGFDALSRIKPFINVWYRTAAQCEQLLMGKQIDMSEFVNGRAFFLQDRGAPIQFVWNEAIRNTTVFVLTKDAPNRENALQFLSFLTRPEPQANFAKLIYYGPTNTRALDLIEDRTTLERLPTYGPNDAKQIVLDVDWWGRNLDRLSPRWSHLISA